MSVFPLMMLVTCPAS